MTRGNPLLDADPGAATWLSIDGSILFLRNRDTQPVRRGRDARRVDRMKPTPWWKSHPGEFWTADQ